jgi:PilZ domain-containing protein
MMMIKRETHRELIGRRSEREGVAIRATLVVESVGKRDPHPAWMVDVSTWGTRLKASVQVPPGQSVALARSFGAGFPVPARVVWARKAEFAEDAELGLEFLQPVPIRYWWR